MYKQLLEKALEWVNDHTPANDKLGHFYWGTLYAYIGLMTALVVSLFTEPYWIYAVLPIMFAGVPAYIKEYRDGTGLGTKEKEDILYTVAPSIPYGFMLLVLFIIVG